MNSVFNSLPKGLFDRAIKLFNNERFLNAKKIQKTDNEGYRWVFYAAQEFLELREYRIAEHFFIEAVKREATLLFGHAGLAVCRFNLDRIGASLKSMHRAISMLINHELSILSDFMESPSIRDTSIPVKGILVGNQIYIGDASYSLLEKTEDDSLPVNDEDFSNLIMQGALYHFGNYCRSKKRYPEAITCFRLAVRIKPDDTFSQTNLGTALSEIGEFQQALVELTKAIVLDPKDAIAYSGLGIVYENLGNRERAIEYLSKAIMIRNGDYPYAQKNLERIRSAGEKAEISKLRTGSVFIS